MLIELKWLNGGNSKTHSTEIYRSDVPFVDISEAVLIATVAPGIDTYADLDVVYGNAYYYRFRNISGNRTSILSREFEFYAKQYTGPGPQQTIFGDEHFGYYGVFPSNPVVVPTLNQVRAALGLGPLSDTFNEAVMHKFAIGGRVRGIHTAPLCSGTEIDRESDTFKTLIAGGSVPLTLGLHSWAIIFPSTVHASNEEHNIQHFPGELRSMLGVVTEMYSRVEDATTGNNTGNRLIPSNGQVPFYSQLEDRFVFPQRWIMSSDWVGDLTTVINWSTPTGPPPLQPKELHIEQADFSASNSWSKSIIWPVIVYTGLTGPR